MTTFAALLFRLFFLTTFAAGAGATDVRDFEAIGRTIPAVLEWICGLIDP